jgi:hypothetical protein
MGGLVQVQNGDKSFSKKKEKKQIHALQQGA